MSAIREEYGLNEAFLRKLPSVERRFRSFRRCRGDGNCFYRAFLLGLTEYFIENNVRMPQRQLPSVPREEAVPTSGGPQVVFERFLAVLESCLPRFGAVGCVQRSSRACHSGASSFEWCFNQGC